MMIENKQELGEALRADMDEIELKGDLARKIKKIYQLDQALWCLCLICLTVAVASLVAAPSTAGASTALCFVAGTPATVLMGAPVAISAVLTAAAGGGIHCLKKLRKRFMKELGDDYIILYLRKGKE